MSGPIDLGAFNQTPGWLAAHAPQGLALFISVIFLDSLRYKFTDHPKTREIFGRLDAWAASGGLRGLFARTGLFSQYVIGAAELAASVLLLAGAFWPAFAAGLPLGAAVAFAVISAAIAFHLFTPLGIDPNNDGAGLFWAACMVWAASLVLICIDAEMLTHFAARLAEAFAAA